MKNEISGFAVTFFMHKNNNAKLNSTLAPYNPLVKKNILRKVPNKMLFLIYAFFILRQNFSLKIYQFQ